MNKIFMNRLTMLAVTLMASMACFAQGKFDKVATELVPHQAGDYFDLNELRYYCESVATGVQYLEVVGFASYVCSDTGDPTLITSKWNGKVTIPNYVEGSGGCAAWVKSVAANAFTTTVCTGDDKPNRDQFTDAAALVTKMDFLYDDKHTYDPAEIEANAFAGLTNVRDITNYFPGDEINDIDEDSFAGIVYDKAELIVPVGAIPDYCVADGWTYFYKVSDGKTKKGDVDDNNKVNILDFYGILEAYWYTDPYDPIFDLDGDGKVNIVDAQMVIDIFGAW